MYWNHKSSTSMILQCQDLKKTQEFLPLPPYIGKLTTTTNGDNQNVEQQVLYCFLPKHSTNQNESTNFPDFFFSSTKNQNKGKTRKIHWNLKQINNLKFLPTTNNLLHLPYSNFLREINILPNFHLENLNNAVYYFMLKLNTNSTTKSNQPRSQS